MGSNPPVTNLACRPAGMDDDWCSLCGYLGGRVGGRCGVLDQGLVYVVFIVCNVRKYPGMNEEMK